MTDNPTDNPNTLLSESASSSEVIDIELAEKNTPAKETARTSGPKPSKRVRTASSTLNDAEERVARALTLVEDAHMDAITNDMEADPTVKHVAPDEAAFKSIGTKVRDVARSTLLPAEAQKLITQAKKQVGFAQEHTEEKGGELDDEDRIQIGRIETNANFMVEHTMDTVLQRQSTQAGGGKGFMQRTMYFKDPALLESNTKNVNSLFQRDVVSGGGTDTAETKTRADGDGIYQNLKEVAEAIAKSDKTKEQREKSDDDDSNKFGMIDGVMISCLLNIFGVIMFLRLGWVIGQAGIVQGCLIILMSGVVTGLTTMSMAAIATNGKVKGGGAYYMISRALGPEIGGTIGVLFFLGLSVAISIYVIGFCEVLVDNLKVCPNVFNTTTGQLSICDPSLIKLTLTGDKLNDVRIWGVILVSFILIMALFGTGWVIQVQKYLMFLLCCTILSVCIGAFVNFDIAVDRAGGFLGPGSEVYENVNINGTEVAVPVPGTSNFLANLGSGYTPQMVGGELKEYSFFSVFAIFFPAVTGIMAGANISGMLKDPAKNIVEGTFLSVGISTMVYCIMSIIIGATCSRTALLNDYFIMMKVELAKSYDMELGFLVLFGVYAATFSSALASIVGAPQMLFSVSVDRILPLSFFATTHKATWGCGKCSCKRCCRYGCCNSKVLFGCYERVDSTTNEKTGKPIFTLATEGTVEKEGSDPVFGYFISFVVAIGCILIGDINFISPLIAMFFMMTYGLLNFACFALSYYETPGWRPKFVYFRWWAALAGAVLCLVCMFLTDATYTAISLTVGLLLVGWIYTREVQTNWGTVLDAKSYVDALNGILHLRTIRQHAKTFRPKYLLFGGDDKERKSLGRFLYELRKGHGGVFVGRVVIGDYRQDLLRVRERFEDCYTCINDSKSIKQTLFGTTEKDRTDYQAFAPLELCLAENFYKGACSLMQSVGVGAIRPNTVVLGYKEDWTEIDDPVGQPSRITTHDYVQTLQVAFKMRFGCMVCRNLNNVRWDEPDESGTVDVWSLLDDGGLTFLIP
jgi:solute carrier family 12 sodium/potassium/chloride transporter 2